MPSTVYKGDLAEVSFAPEVGVSINANTDANMTIATVAGNDFTTITFSAQSNAVLFKPSFTLGSGAYNNDPTITHASDANTEIRVGMTVTSSGAGIPASSTVASITSATEFELSASTTGGAVSGATLTFLSNALRYPKNMLVGSQVKWTDTGSTIDANDTAGVFTIVENDGRTLKISPAMKTGGATLSAAAIDLHILPYKTPPFDTTMNESKTGGVAEESVLTDQFLGIANALTVPETKVDLKRFHVVGLGRDTSVQVPGKLITEGGSFEVAMHSARWLKYCLGGELAHPVANPEASHFTTLDGATKAGQSFITLTDDHGNLAADHYVLIVDTTYVPVTTTHEADISDAALQWDGSFTDTRFDTALRSEVRRVIGMDGTKVYLDEPLLFPHADNMAVQFIDFNDAPNTNPPTVSSTGVIADAQTHLLFTHTHQPSFALEVSQRRRDVDTDDGAVDGTATDSKELTRVFRGCKVTDFTLTTDNDAALRLAVNFNAALCYTDTARLEGSTSRYASHRMFNDTANTDIKRFQSGIGPKTQKPFMFYNGTINMAGVQVAQVLNFSLTGQTGMQAFHVINGENSQTSATSQVPFGGSRNTSLMVEGQTSYEMTMEIGVDDPLFYHKMRSTTEFSSSEDGTTTNQIRINFEKTTTSGTTERMMLIIDDYYIIEAPLQIPEDKGMVKSQLKIMPKTIKVISRDTIVKY
jgi:hypothetical protein